MKSKNYLYLFIVCRFLFVYLILLGLCHIPVQAQKTNAAGGYGNATYTGLQQDAFLKKWMILGPIKGQ